MLKNYLAIILAAGKGSRMRSSIPKGLHKIGGLPLIFHVINSMQLITKKIAVIVGHKNKFVSEYIRSYSSNILIYEQNKQLGTAHAVLSAKEILQKDHFNFIISFADTPLIEKNTLQKINLEMKHGSDIVITGFHSNKKLHGYGRIIKHKGKLQGIVEEKNASKKEKEIMFYNGGLMAIKGKYLLSLLENIIKRELQYDLTKVVSMGIAKGLNVTAIEVSMDNIIGINNQSELTEAERIWQDRQRIKLMNLGVIIQAPETVFLSYDTYIEKDVIIEPYVVLGPNVKICKGSIIHSFSYIEGAIVGEYSEIGPYSRIRPGVCLEKSVKIGNFCEINQSSINHHTKVNHLTYIGNSKIGSNVNIGAGTITCNYDGYNKSKTFIGNDAFVGSNTSLVAPISIGENSYIASGSVITKDVSNNALVFGRSPQTVKENESKNLRKRLMKKNKKHKEV